MGLFNTNIGLEFQRQMKPWLTEHPEVYHEWRNNDLIIYHPTDKRIEIYFKLDSKSVTIYFQEIIKKFKKELFRDIATQVLKIRGYWINDIINKEDLKIRNPKLSGGEVAVLHCNSKGQVLTIGLNLYTGWGEVYKIFSSVDDAKTYCNSIKNDQIETSIFNSDYTYIE